LKKQIPTKLESELKKFQVSLISKSQVTHRSISDRVMDQNVNFNMATATILDFVGCGFWRSKLSRDLIFSLCVKFGANSFKNSRIIDV